MTNPTSPSRTTARVVRWIARILSALIIMVMLSFFIGEGLLGGKSPYSRPINTWDIIQLVLAGIELVGLGIAWKKELVGGSITLVAFIIKGMINPRTLGFPLLLIPFTAILFLICWWLSRAPQQGEVSVSQSS